MGVYTTIDPATGEQSATYPEISDAELNDLIGRSAAAYRSWRTTPLDQRRAVLTRAAEIHREQADELAKLLTLEMGKPIAQAKGEVELVASIYQYYADHVAEFMSDEPLDIAGPGTAVVRTEPIGPLVGVMPWNYPLLPGSPLRGAEHRAGQHDHPQARAELPAVGAGRRTGPARGRPARGVYLNAFISTAGRGSDRRSTRAGCFGDRIREGRIRRRRGRRQAHEEGRARARRLGPVPGARRRRCRRGREGRSRRPARQRRAGLHGVEAVHRRRPVYDEFVQKLVDGMAGWQPADPTSPDTKLGPLASNSGAEELDELVQEAISRGAKSC